MRGEIPTTLGLLTLVGCSDAAALGNALERVCKEQCECPAIAAQWNELANCKKSCEGYAIQLEALVADEATSEPCADFNDILGDMKDCAKRDQCEMTTCLYEEYARLYMCWPDAFNSTYYYNYSATGPEAISGAELTHQLLVPIPEAIPPQRLHSATSD